MTQTIACKKHDVEELPSGYDRCPLCEEERRIEAEERHRIVKDDRMEPY
jgi:hypothetical protein